MAETLTLAEIRAYHVAHHCGFIWECPYCKDAYWQAKQSEENETEE